ncbi:AsnC family transcriptional regulator [Ramlibacter sp.]|uniref:AsnC family transcriptional regulator n=1 Tax=Ramlibacter sp. TaxID=1917967 RepID=UPI0035B00D0D
MNAVHEQVARDAQGAARRDHALADCLRVSAAHASLNLKLDEELGTWHGLAWADFRLLDQLDAAGGASGLTALVRPLGQRAPAVLRQVLQLEKTGLVAREPAPGASSGRIVLRPAGRRVLQEARLTAGAICAAAAGPSPAATDDAPEWLEGLARSPALAL